MWKAVLTWLLLACTAYAAKKSTPRRQTESSDSALASTTSATAPIVEIVEGMAWPTIRHEARLLTVTEEDGVTRLSAPARRPLDSLAQLNFVMPATPSVTLSRIQEALPPFAVSSSWRSLSLCYAATCDTPLLQWQLGNASIWSKEDVQWLETDGEDVLVSEWTATSDDGSVQLLAAATVTSDVVRNDEDVTKPMLTPNTARLVLSTLLPGLDTLNATGELRWMRLTVSCDFEQSAVLSAADSDADVNLSAQQRLALQADSVGNAFLSWPATYSMMNDSATVADVDMEAVTAEWSEEHGWLLTFMFELDSSAAVYDTALQLSIGMEEASLFASPASSLMHSSLALTCFLLAACLVLLL